MKAKQQEHGEKKARKHYSAEFKDQALKRAEKDGVATAAGDLGLSESQIYSWRQKKRLEGLTTPCVRIVVASLELVILRDRGRKEARGGSIF